MDGFQSIREERGHGQYTITSLGCGGRTVLREALSASLAGSEGSGKGILPSWREKPISTRRARSPVCWG